MRERRILLTGFEPFGAHDMNPSAILAERLHGEQVGECRTTGAILPVAAVSAPGALLSALDDVQPDIVLSLGLAGGRNALALERVAINVLDFDSPDNAGYFPVDEPIVLSGPDAYFATLPLRSTVNAWREAGVPGYISNTAGTYICNQVLYTALMEGSRRGLVAGFIHVPFLPEQVLDRPQVSSMSLDLMLRGVRIALNTAVRFT